ncbi:MAG: hypothetical protein ABH851_05950 [Methanobacteriota archaeon]
MVAFKQRGGDDLEPDEENENQVRAREFLQYFGIQEGNTVVLVGTTEDGEVAKEVLRRDANLILIDTYEPLIGEYRKMLEREFPDVEGEMDLRAVDFPRVKIPDGADLVVFGDIINSPFERNPGGYLEKACEITQNKGCIALCDVFMQEHNRDFVERTAHDLGYHLDYQGSLAYDKRGHVADSWFCTKL